MNIIDRQISKAMLQSAKWYPVVSVTGPRQSGKSTLIQHVFPDYDYVNLENPQVREIALEDPVGFIESRPEHLIIDEIQLVPDLFSMIQVKSDRDDVAGNYVLSGSQNFALVKGIQQSLAGRVELLKLMPFSYSELRASGPNIDTDEFMFKGGYPRLYKADIPPSNYYRNYINTYLLRDVKGLISESNTSEFRKFLTICALHAGNLVNLTNLGEKAGVSRQTAKSWLSVLEASYIAFQLQPFYENKVKTMTKTPKLFFYDTGLLCHLLGINSLERLLLSKYLGMVYENFIIAETLKSHYNANLEPTLYFYRDKSGAEIGLIDATDMGNTRAIEIKSSQTHHAEYHRHLNAVGEKLGISDSNRHVVMRTDTSYNSKQGSVLSTKDYLASL